ncbi:MAG: CDP-alcohol phosphatidyltransferase family protein [Desulfarculaceae bacterium]
MDAQTPPQAGQALHRRQEGVFVRWVPRWVTPNHLTIMRMGLSLVILWMSLTGTTLGWIILLGLVAGFSDLLDGGLARQRGLVTKLGAFLDPVGDKLFALVLAILVWYRGWVPYQLLLALIITEIHVVMIPVFVVIQRWKRQEHLWPPPKVQPNRWGKVKTGWVASALGLVVIGAWIGWPPLVYFAVANIGFALALGIVAEVMYWSAWWRGAYV